MQHEKSYVLRNERNTRTIFNDERVKGISLNR